MNKQKQKGLLKFQLDHQPQKWQWRDTALFVSVIAGVLSAICFVAYTLIEVEIMIISVAISPRGEAEKVYYTFDLRQPGCCQKSETTAATKTKQSAAL